MWVYILCGPENVFLKRARYGIPANLLIEAEALQALGTRCCERETPISSDHIFYSGSDVWRGKMCVRMCDRRVRERLIRIIWERDLYIEDESNGAENVRQVRQASAIHLMPTRSPTFTPTFSAPSPSFTMWPTPSCPPTWPACVGGRCGHYKRDDLSYLMSNFLPLPSVRRDYNAHVVYHFSRGQLALHFGDQGLGGPE